MHFTLRLTESSREPVGLVVVDYGHAERVEAHHAQHDPVETVSLHHTADEEADPLLFTPEVRRAVHLTAALHAGPTKRGAGRSCE